MNNKKEDKKIEEIKDNKIDNVKNNIECDENLIIIDTLNKKIEDLENKINLLNKKELDNELRYRAEIENINRRSSIEIDKAYKYSLENFMIELVIVIDNLERALNLNVSSDNFLDIKEGIELTLKSFLNTTNKFGLISINDINIPFNPSIHQAVIVSSSKDYKPNYVINIMQKGYLLNEKLIRPAMVQVSSNLNDNDEEKLM